MANMNPHSDQECVERETEGTDDGLSSKISVSVTFLTARIGGVFFVQYEIL